MSAFVQFDNEISKDLRPRLERTGDQDLLQTFLDYFSGKSFQVGTSLLALWEGESPLIIQTREQNQTRMPGERTHVRCSFSLQ